MCIIFNYMSENVKLNPRNVSLSEAHRQIVKNKVNEQIRAMKEATNQQFPMLVRDNNVRISKHEIYNLLYKFQHYERDGKCTAIYTNARNKIEQFCDRCNWYTYGHKVLKCERINDTQWRLVIDIPFEEVETMFSRDLKNRLNKIDQICK